VQLGEEQVCESPTEGLDRFVEAAEAHGLTRRVGAETNGDSSIPLAVGIAAADADSDGDIDLFLSVESAFPQVLENDGSGHFTEVPQNVALDAVQAIALLGFAVVDFDGDGLRDVLLFGPRSVELSRNLGGLEFAPLRTVYSESANEVGVSISASFGDVDLDGDLDLFLPGLDPVASQAPTEFGQSPSVDRLLLREKAQFVLGTTMEAAVGPGISMVGLFTDRDSDGDQDLLVPTLRGAFGMAPTAFYRNTGDDETSELFHEDASQIHADLAMSGMGVDSADLNRDEDLDYCISDLNRIQCLLSDGDGAFYEGAQALGLMLPDAPPGNGWSGWSIDLVDLDNDGHLDAVVAGGAPLNEVGDGLDYSHSPNQIWQGGEEGFTRHSSALLAGETDHYGLLSADLNGDGAQDLLFSGRDGELQAYYSQCTSGSWVDVQLAGPPGNEQGLERGSSCGPTSVDGSDRFRTFVVSHRALHGLILALEMPSRLRS